MTARLAFSVPVPVLPVSPASLAELPSGTWVVLDHIATVDMVGPTEARWIPQQPERSGTGWRVELRTIDDLRVVAQSWPARSQIDRVTRVSGLIGSVHVICDHDMQDRDEAEARALVRGILDALERCRAR